MSSETKSQNDPDWDETQDEDQENNQKKKDEKNMTKFEERIHNAEMVCNNKYMKNCIKTHEVPMPAFVVMKQNCMFLCEFKISSIMAKNLEEYLEAV